MIVGLIALGALFLSACAAGQASRRRDDEVQSPPEWTKGLGTSPEIARECSFDQSLARQRATLRAQGAIVDRYCGQDTGTGLREAEGNLFMSSPRRMFAERQGEMACVTIELEWGALQCINPDGTSQIVTNPRLNIQP